MTPSTRTLMKSAVTALATVTCATALVATSAGPALANSSKRLAVTQQTQAGDQYCAAAAVRASLTALGVATLPSQSSIKTVMSGSSADVPTAIEDVPKGMNRYQSRHSYSVATVTSAASYESTIRSSLDANRPLILAVNSRTLPWNFNGDCPKNGLIASPRGARGEVWGHAVVAYGYSFGRHPASGIEFRNVDIYDPGNNASAVAQRGIFVANATQIFNSARSISQNGSSAFVIR